MKIGIDIRAIGRKRTGDETYTLSLVRNLLKIDSQNQYRLYTDTANLIEIDQIKSKIGLTAKKILRLFLFYLLKNLFGPPGQLLRKFSSGQLIFSIPNTLSHLFFLQKPKLSPLFMTFLLLAILNLFPAKTFFF